jgi:undecaprenyl diphosphate synthase
MELFKRYALREADEIDASNVRFTCIGRRSGLPVPLQRVIAQMEARTRTNTGLRLQVALNYGGLQEIVDTVRSLVGKGLPITEDTLLQEVYGDVEPPELIIRTGGEIRTSGFMPFAPYAEWAFTETLWPDFTIDEFDRICNTFRSRERRYGGLAKATA